MTRRRDSRAESPAKFGDGSTKSKSKNGRRKMNYERHVTMQLSVPVSHLEAPLIDLLKAWRVIQSTEDVSLDIKDTITIPVTIKIPKDQEVNTIKYNG